jgi:hypothetical protein
MNDVLRLWAERATWTWSLARLSRARRQGKPLVVKR